jgi:hypothetical protein
LELFALRLGIANSAHAETLLVFLNLAIFRMASKYIRMLNRFFIFMDELFNEER